MSAYWDGYSNALAAGQTTIDAFQKGQQRRLGREAGNALAQGDYSGAAGVLYRGGDLEGGTQVDRFGQQRQQQALTAEAQAQDQRREGVRRGAEAMRSVPQEQRAAVYQATIRPTFQQLGMPEDLLMQMDQAPMDDASLDAMIAALGGDRPGVKYYPTKDGVVAVRDGEMTGQLAYDAPEDPNAALERDLLQARIDATRAQVPLRQAQTARAGRPAAGRGGAAPKPPAGFILDGN